MSRRFYAGVRAAAGMVARPLFDFTVSGVERFPERGPVVVVAVHRSFLDPACVGLASPRQVRFLIVRRVYEKAWAHWFYRRMDSLPVDPAERRSLVSLRRALAHLRDGGVVGVFPEGRVVWDQSDAVPLQPGAALLAVRARATVVAMRIEGSGQAWPHGRRFPRRAPVRVTVCPPIVPPAAGGRDRRAVGELTEKIRELLEDAPNALARGAS